MQRVEKIVKHLSDATIPQRNSTLNPQCTLASDETSFGGYVNDLYQSLTGELQFSSKKHGGALVASVLQAHGIKFLFTLSGGHISPMYVTKRANQNLQD